MSDYKEYCHEQRDRNKNSRARMVECPWANFQHKTWPGEICMRCNKPVDMNGFPVHGEIE